MKKILVKLLVVASALFFFVATPALAVSNYYINSKGNLVHIPVNQPVIPKGATAQCKDLTYSFSQSRRGTCSGHKGVLKWLK